MKKDIIDKKIYDRLSDDERKAIDRMADDNSVSKSEFNRKYLTIIYQQVKNSRDEKYISWVNSLSKK